MIVQSGGIWTVQPGGGLLLSLPPVEGGEAGPLDDGGGGVVDAVLGCGVRLVTGGLFSVVPDEPVCG